jgi:hypothetical protein
MRGPADFEATPELRRDSVNPAAERSRRRSDDPLTSWMSRTQVDRARHVLAGTARPGTPAPGVTWAHPWRPTARARKTAVRKTARHSLKDLGYDHFVAGTLSGARHPSATPQKPRCQDSHDVPWLIAAIVAEYLPSGQIDSPTELSEYYIGNLPFLWRRIKRPEPWQPWLTWQVFDSKTIILPG